MKTVAPANTRGFFSSDDAERRTRIALVSVAASLALTGVKFVTAVVTNSLAMYSEAGHSAVDTLAVVITFVAIRKAVQPPDHDHLYGHAKYESIGAFVQLLFLVAVAGAVLVQAFRRMFVDPQPVEIGPLVFAVMGLSLVVEGWRTLALMRAARQTRSEALAASSTHFLTDFLDSFVVIFGLVMTSLGYPSADSIAAVFVAGVIIMLSLRIGRDVFNSLTDRAPAGIREEVEQIALRTESVIGVHDVRVRRAGPQLFTEMHVELSAEMKLGETHRILDLIEDSLCNRFPNMHVVTHPEPVEQPTS